MCLDRLKEDTLMNKLSMLGTLANVETRVLYNPVPVNNNSIYVINNKIYDEYVHNAEVSMIGNLMLLYNTNHCCVYDIDKQKMPYSQRRIYMQKFNYSIKRVRHYTERLNDCKHLLCSWIWSIVNDKSLIYNNKRGKNWAINENYNKWIEIKYDGDVTYNDTDYIVIQLRTSQDRENFSAFRSYYIIDKQGNIYDSYVSNYYKRVYMKKHKTSTFKEEIMYYGYCDDNEEYIILNSSLKLVARSKQSIIERSLNVYLGDSHNKSTCYLCYNDTYVDVMDYNGNLICRTDDIKTKDVYININIKKDKSKTETVTILDKHSRVLYREIKNKTIKCSTK